jgi:NAD(P)-dependent dehydrogenase (short-subunit alcohol dehydrogenase family)
MNILDRFSLKGRVALVTGGSGPQVGTSISEALVEAGATLITASRSAERNRAFAAELGQRGFKAYGMELDITDLDSISQLHDQVIRQFGRLDILVNSARIELDGSFETQTAEDWLHSARGDMAGLFAICKGFVMDMARQQKGSIINVSSIYGVIASDPTLYEGTGMVHPPHYNFIKAGMINFTRHIANFYGKQGIRANCISPGGYFATQQEPFVQNYCRRVPLGRMLNDQDIKGAVVYLASDASEYVTGTNLLIDGGWTAL